MSWEAVEEKFKSRQTSWVQIYSKDDLLAIWLKYEVEVPQEAKLDSVRKILTEAVRSRAGDNTVEKKPKVAQVNVNTIEPFKKGQNGKRSRIN